MDKLEIAMLKGTLTGDELAQAASRIAEETASMNTAEKAAFLQGLKRGISILAITENRAVLVRVASAMIVAASEA